MELLFRIIAYIICLFTSSSVIAQIWPPEGMQGDGTNENPWEITMPEHLAILAIYVNAGNGPNTIDKYYKLMNDINLSAYTNWKPIGISSSSGYYTSFHGNLNGNYKIVKNLIIRRSTENNIGLFGVISDAGSIENLGVEDCDIVGGDNAVGGLAGYSNANINNCHVTGMVKGNRSLVGGLIGNNSNGTITNCYAVCNVSSTDNIGGLVGWNFGTITNCYATGNINGGGEMSGGLVGINSGYVSNCYASSTVNGNMLTGGLIGSNYGYVIQCFATGDVNGGSHIRGGIGGLVGEHNQSNITNCYATGNVNGNYCVGGLVGRSYISTISNSYASCSVNTTGFGGNIGGLVGEGIKTSVFGCHATGNVNGKGDGVGGLVGFNDGSCTITNSYAIGDVITSGNLSRYVGGLVGDNCASTIINCFATGSVSGIFEDVGGLVGRNGKNSIISYCYATGSVSGSYNVGGLVGINHLENPTIYNCIAANASVVATTNTVYVNHIVGNADYGVCNNNYALNTMIVLSNGLPVTITDGSPEAGIGKPLDTLQNFAFYNLANNWYNNAWDIDTEANPGKIWKICDNLSLPFFQREERDCDFFTIYATAGSNGIIDPLGEIPVLPSTDRTFAFLADEGFKVDSLLIDGVNKPELIAAGNYTFKNITTNHTIHVTFFPVLNIKEIRPASILTIYPNPTTGKLRFEISNMENEILEIEIFDIFGRNIVLNLKSQNQISDISRLTSGIYLLRIKTEKDVITKKIIKH